jgi:hypothetical protein
VVFQRLVDAEEERAGRRKGGHQHPQQHPTTASHGSSAGSRSSDVGLTSGRSVMR